MITALLAAALAVPAVTAPPPAPPPVVATGPDRSSPPPVAPPAPMVWPELERHAVAPGVELVGWRLPGARRVEVEVIIHGGLLALDGQAIEPSLALSSQWGLATTTATPAQLSTLLDTADIGLSAWIDYDTATVGVDAATEDLGQALGVLRDVLREPVFPKDELKRYQAERKSWLTLDAPNDLRAAMSGAADAAWYKPGAPYGDRPELGALKRLKPADLAARHARLLKEWPITIVAAGDVAMADLAVQLRDALAGVGADAPRAAHPVAPLPAGPHLLVVEMPGATQAAIGVRMAAPTRGAADAAGFRLADFALGGHFLARLNRNLREEHGWTYGIYSDWERDEANARWGASCIVSADDVAEALGELQAEITEVGAEGATAAEIDAGWRDALSGWNTALRTAESAVGLARGLVLAEDTAAGRRALLDGLSAVTPGQSRDAAAAWLTPAHALWVVVGDPDALAPELAGLPWPITRVSASDAVLGTFQPPGHTP